MILSKNYVKRLSSIRKFSSHSFCFRPQKVSPIFLYCLLSESPSESSVLRVFPGNPKNTRVTSPLFIVPQRRKPLGTGCFYIHSETMTPPNSMGMRNCWGHLQATLEFGVFQFIPPHWNRPYLSPTSFIEDFT